MEIIKESFLSSNKRNKVFMNEYNLNIKNLKGIVIILHGMSECKEMYTEFAEYLANKEYGVVTYDHIGHGESINTPDDRGFFSNEKGEEYLLKDLKTVVNITKKYNIPIFLLGHSMGSLIIRNYIATLRNEDIKKENLSRILGVVLCGTIGPQWAIDSVIQFTDFLIDKKGPRYRSRKLHQILKKISSFKFDETKTRFDWITRDKEIIDKIKNDERVNFVFTVSGFKSVFELTKKAGEKEVIENTPKELPILILSGSKDILGEYGEGVKRLENAYIKAKMKNVTMKIYENNRHALLLDLDRKDIFKDIYEWLECVRIAEE